MNTTLVKRILISTWADVGRAIVKFVNLYDFADSQPNGLFTIELEKDGTLLFDIELRFRKRKRSRSKPS